MLANILRFKIVIGLTVLLLVLIMISPFKASLQNGIALEANAHLNELMASPNSFLLSSPAPISGGAKAVTELLKTPIATDDELNAWLDRSQTQALIVQKKGRIIYQRYSADADDGRNTNAMSMTKTIIAILIGIAIDEGLINSEKDSISLYLPEIKQLPTHAITLRDLLRHTSGIQSTSQDLRATLGGNPLITPLSAISFKGDRSFRYDNINYHLLSLALTRVYKKPLNRLIEDKLWHPLNLEKAAIINTTGYCCVFATARSWLEIGNLFLNPTNGVVSSHWINKMVKDTLIPEWFFVQATGKSAGNTYGYHLYGGLPELSEVFWIEGMGLQLVMINPQTQTIIVRLGGIPSALNVFSNRYDSSIIAPLLKTLTTEH